MPSPAKPRPRVVIFAGPNGAGKSTHADAILAALGIETFVNADYIARGLSGRNTEAVAFEAGRIMLMRLGNWVRQEPISLLNQPCPVAHSPCFCTGSSCKATPSQFITFHWQMPNWLFDESNCAWRWAGTTFQPMWCDGDLDVA